MNKIYKVIWSKTKHCYVVASEIAKRNGKAGSVVSKSILPLLIALSLAGAGASYSMAQDTNWGAAGNTASSGKGTATAFGGAATDASSGKYVTAATNTNATAFGEGTNASGTNATAFGQQSSATEKAATAFGQATVASGARSTAFGEKSQASGQVSTAFGNFTRATNTGATAFGNGSISSGLYSASFGAGDAAGRYATAFGNGTIAGIATDENGAITLTRDDGSKVKVDAADYGGYTNGQYVTTGGSYEAYTGPDGRTYSADGSDRMYTVLKTKDGKAVIKNYKGEFYDVIIQSDGTAKADLSKLSRYRQSNLVPVSGIVETVDNATAFGNETVASGKNSTSFGNDTTASGENATAFGSGSVASGENATAFGVNSTAAGDNSLAALGGTTAADAENAAAIGAGAQADKKDTLALGSESKALAEDTVAIGRGAAANAAGAVALGADSVAGEAQGTASSVINGKTYSYAGTKPVGTVSVGADDKERTITHVAAGQVTETSTDAINGSQLYAVNQAVGDNGTRISHLEEGWKLTTAEDGGEASSTGVSSVRSGDTVTVAAGSNIRVAQNGNTISVAVSDTPAFTKVTETSVPEDGKAGSTTVTDAEGTTVTKTDEEGNVVESSSLSSKGVTNTKNGESQVIAPAGEADTEETTEDDGTVTSVTTTPGETTQKIDQGSSLSGDQLQLTAKDTTDAVTNTVTATTTPATEGTPEETTTTVKKEEVKTEVDNTNDQNAKGITLTETTTTTTTTTIDDNPSESVMTTETNTASYGPDGVTISNVVNGSPVSNVSLTGSGLNNGGNTITNVAPGESGTDAVNMNQLNAQMVHFYSVNSTDSSAGNYNNNGASGTNALAAGVNAAATADYAVAIGNGTNAWSADSVAIGDSASVWGNHGIAIGGAVIEKDEDGNDVKRGPGAGTDAIAVGKAANAYGEGGLAVGSNTGAGTNAAAFGPSANASGMQSVAVGANANSYGISGTAVGTSSGASDNSAALGVKATASGPSSVAAGFSSGATGANSVAIGTVSKASGSDTAAMGSNAGATGSDTIALGTRTSSSGNRTASLGAYSGAEGTDTVALGSYAGSSGTRSIAIGSRESRSNGAKAAGTDTMAIGTEASASGLKTTAIGYQADAAGYNAVAIGVNANSTANYSSASSAVAIGRSANATMNDYGYSALALGESANATSRDSTAIGKKAQAVSGTNALAAGTEAAATAHNTTAIGYQSRAYGVNSTAMGNNAWATGVGAIAIGSATATNDTTGAVDSTLRTGAYSKNTVAIGTNAAATTENALAFGTASAAKAGNAVAIGNQALAANDSSVAVGDGAKAQGARTLAAGTNAVTGGEDSVAIGTKSLSAGAASLALGRGSRAEGEGSIAAGRTASAAGESAVSLGDGALAEEMNAVALGKNAAAHISDSVAIGSESVASTDKGQAGYDVTGFSHKADTTGTWKSTMAAVSVGDVANGLTRQITGVAAGTQDTDAVNVAQLKRVSVSNKTEVVSSDHTVSVTPMQSMEDGHMTYDVSVNKGSVSANKNGSVSFTNPTYVEEGVDEEGNPTYETKPVENSFATVKDVANVVNHSGFTLTTSQSDGTVSGPASELIHPGDTVTVDAGKNIKINQDGKTISIATADDLSVNSVTATTTTTDGVGNTITTKTVMDGNGTAVTRTKTDQESGEETVISSNTSNADGMTVMDQDGNTVSVAPDKISLESGDETKPSSSITNEGVSITNPADADKTVSLTDKGLDNGGNKITRVEKGDVSSTSTDAVNGSQLYETNQKIDGNSQEIENLKSGFTVATGQTGSGTADDKTVDEETKKVRAGDTVTYRAGNNLKVEQDGKTITYAMQDKITLGSGSNQVTVDGTSGKVTAGSVGTGPMVTIDSKGGSINLGGDSGASLKRGSVTETVNDGQGGTTTQTNTTYELTGLTNRDLSAPDYAQAGRAATEEQLEALKHSLGNVITESETRMGDGTNTQVTGAGTTADPYKVNVNPTLTHMTEVQFDRGDNRGAINGQGYYLTKADNIDPEDPTHILDGTKEIRFALNGMSMGMQTVDNVGSAIEGQAGSGYLEKLKNANDSEAADTDTHGLPKNSAVNVGDLYQTASALEEKGLKFGANSGGVASNRLGSAVTVKGAGEKEDTAYDGSNIKTKVSQDADGNTAIDVMLDKDLAVDSVTAGNTVLNEGGVTITNPKDAGRTVSLTDSGLNNGGNVISNVASGGDTLTNVANIGDVKKAGKTYLAGTNIASIEKGTSDENGTSYTINAKGAAVAAGANTHVSSEEDSSTHVTTYTVSADKAAVEEGRGMTVSSKEETDVSGAVTTTYTVGLSDETNQKINYGESAYNRVTNDGITFKGDTDNTSKKKLGDTMVINGDANITTAVDTDGSMKVQLNQDLKNISSISNTKTDPVSGNTTGTSLTLSNTENKVDAGGAKVTNIAKGNISDTSTDAVNGSQIKDMADSIADVIGGNTTVGNDGTLRMPDTGIANTGKTNVSDAITAARTKVTSKDKTVKVTETEKNGAYTYDLSISKAGIGTGEDGKAVTPDGGDGLATAGDVVNAINNSGFTLKSSAAEDGEKDAASSGDEVIRPGSTVEMTAGRNMKITQEANGKITYSTRADVNFDSVTSTTKDAAGNTVSEMKLDGSGITIAPKTSTTSTVRLSDKGLNNGNNVITRVKSGLTNADGSASPLEEAKGDTLTNAANIGDLQTAVTDVTKKGLLFMDSSGRTKTNALGSRIGIRGEGNKKDSSYSGENIKTKISQDRNGNSTLEIMMDKNLRSDSVKVGPKDGKDGVSITGPSGADGTDGKVGISGKDGKDAVSISGKDGEGHIGLAGPAGTNGKDGTSIDITVKNGYDGANGVKGRRGADGKDGLARIVYTDGTGEHQVATMDDGVKYAGDIGNAAIKLNNTATLAGGVTDEAKLSDNNIGVVAAQDGDDARLTVKLAKDLQDLSSVETVARDNDGNVTGVTKTTGDGITINTKDNLNDDGTVKDDSKTVSLTKDGLNNGGKQVTNLGSGSDGTDAEGKKTYNTDTNGANIGDVKQIAGDVAQELEDKGLNFGANSGKNVTNKLGSTVKVEGTGIKADDQYSGNNVKTVVRQDEDGNTTIHVLLDKDLTADSMTVGGKGMDGRDGKDGTMGVAGKNGVNGVTLTAVGEKGEDGKEGAEGHIGLAGPAGTNGKDGTNAIDITVKNGYDGANGVKGEKGADGKDGLARIVYTDRTGEHQVATMDDGVKYAGDVGTASIKLNNTATIAGGVTDEAKLSDNNIGVVAAQDGDDARLTVKLAKDLQDLSSASFKDGNRTTTVNGSGITIAPGSGTPVSLTDKGLDNGGKRITNVAPGVADTDAVNMSQLKKVASQSGHLTTVKAKDSNVTVTEGTNVAGGKEYTVGLGDKVALGDKDKAVTVDGTKGTITAGDKVSLDGSSGTVKAGNVSINGSSGEISGLTNTTYDAGTTGKGDRAGIAATEGQLSHLNDQLKNIISGNDGGGFGIQAEDGKKIEKNLGDAVEVAGDGKNISTAVSDGKIKISLNDSIRVDKVTAGTLTSDDGRGNTASISGDTAIHRDAAGDSTTVNGSGITIAPSSGNPVSLTDKGLDNGGNRITNVAPGVKASDAATVGQLGSAVSNINNNINELGGEIRDVAAAGAALAGLKPIQYDPLEPTQIMAAVGNYRNSTAAAVGVAHYTREDLMFHAGATVGTKHNMFNAGVTWKFGPASRKAAVPEQYKAGPISASYVMQDEVRALKAENDALRKDNEQTKAALEDVLKRLAALEAKK